MIFSSTACANRPLRRSLYGAIIGLLFVASGCSSVAPNSEQSAQVPAAYVDPTSSLGSTAPAASLHSDSDEEIQTTATPNDRP